MTIWHVMPTPTWSDSPKILAVHQQAPREHFDQHEALKVSLSNINYLPRGPLPKLRRCCGAAVSTPEPPHRPLAHPEFLTPRLRLS